MSDRAEATAARLVAAGSELFAARGFHGTTMRDIAARARVNLAAANYHYGSKKALYLEVLRAQFAALRESLARRGAAPTATVLARLSRAELTALLCKRLEVMLETMIAPPRLHADLMVREMTDPSEALPVIVDELIAPMRRDMEQIVTRLVPGLDHGEIERCLFSIVGQVLFYRFMRPAVLRMMGWEDYPAELAGQLAAHITALSLDGMDGVGARQRRGRRGR